MELNAYLDGQLGPEEAAQIERMMAEDESLKSRLHDYTRQNAAIASAARAMDDDTVNFKTAALERRLAAALERRARPRRIIAMPAWPSQVAAAALLVGFGWFGHAQLAAPGSGVPEYVSEAVGAHMVFAEDMSHPAEFTADAISPALPWFSQKLGVDVAMPDLGALGYDLVGARMLGTKEGPLAQFIFEDATGARVSLTVAKHPENLPMQDFAMADFSRQKVGYWSRADSDYALVAEGDDARIHQIVQQLN